METAFLLTPLLPLTLSLLCSLSLGKGAIGFSFWLSTLWSLTLGTFTRYEGSAVFPDTPKVTSLTKTVALIYDYKHYCLEGKLTGITYIFRKALSMLSPMGIYSFPSHRLLNRFIVLDIDSLQRRGVSNPIRE